MPPCDHPDRLRPLLAVASLLVSYVPSSSAAKVRGAVSRWFQFLSFVGLRGAVADWRVVLAFVVVRCCPPVDAVLPPFVVRPVLPSTAAGDIDACNRAARLGVEGMTGHDAAFSDFRVSALLQSIKARAHRLQTSKKPLLFNDLVAYWRARKRDGDAASIRDGFAAVLAMTFGTRASELTSLTTEDLEVVTVFDGATGSMTRNAVRLTFRNVKTRQSVFSTLDPFRVTSAHPLLMEAFSAFDDIVEFVPDATIFRSADGRDSPMGREWLDRIAKAIDPATSPHSFRVGLATELWSARVPLQDIMAIGRWGSVAAILYIVGSLERQVSASDRLGKGRLIFESGNLHRSLGTSISPSDVPSACAARWSAYLTDASDRGQEFDDD